MKFNERIGKRIRQLREERKMTMEKLAYESGVSKGGLSEIERGLKEPRISTLYKIADVLELHIKDFFEF